MDDGDVGCQVAQLRHVADESGPEQHAAEQAVVIHPATGDVTVRGYDPADRGTERDVVIPSATWTHLVAQLQR